LQNFDTLTRAKEGATVNSRGAQASAQIINFRTRG